jgi:hypothetical protein
VYKIIFPESEKKGRTRKRRVILLFCMGCIVISSILGSIARVCSISYTEENPYISSHNFSSSVTIPEESMIYLAEMYAPLLWFYKDSIWEEPFTLIDPDYFIKNSHLVNGDYHLREEGYQGAKTLQEQYNGVKNPVYIRVTTDEYQGTPYLVIQYWFHYLYNYTSAFSVFSMDHQGEWEMIEVILEYNPTIVEGTVHPEPYMVAYSRHSTGEAHLWESESVEKEHHSGYHPVAYIAYGTHAAYFKDLGWNEDLNKGISISYNDMTFLLIDNAEWLHFSGKWGAQKNSPLGPQYQGDKWSTPVAWAENRVDYYQFHVGDSGYLTLINDENQKIGMVNGEYINEIEGAYAVIRDNYTYYYVPKDEYTINIAAQTECIDFDIITHENGKEIHISYEQELVTHIVDTFNEVSSNISSLKIRAKESFLAEILINIKDYSVLFWLVIVALVIVLVYKLKR